MTTLKTRIAAGIGALGIALGGAIALPGTASAAANCQGSSYSGHCVDTTNVVSGEIILDTVPLQNNSPYTATMTCSFGQSATAELSATATVSAEVSGQIVGAVKATAGVSASVSVTASASASTEAAGSIELGPGQSVVCQRFASVYTTNVHEYDYSQSGTSNERNYSATVPSTIGARIS